MGKEDFFMNKEKLGAKETLKQNFTVFGNLRVMICAALLAALSIVLGKFLQIPNPFQDFIRISFENTPIIMAGMFFGPFVGAVTGAVADLLGCVIYDKSHSNVRCGVGWTSFGHRFSLYL